MHTVGYLQGCKRVPISRGSKGSSLWCTESSPNKDFRKSLSSVYSSEEGFLLTPDRDSPAMFAHDVRSWLFRAPCFGTEGRQIPTQPFKRAALQRFKKWNLVWQEKHSHMSFTASPLHFPLKIILVFASFIQGVMCVLAKWGVKGGWKGGN